MTAFSRATITIATDPPQEVQAMVRGGLAVHGSAGLYTVTHVASGKAICHSDQQRTAKGIAIELLEMDVVWDAVNLARWEGDRVLAYLGDMARIIDGQAIVLASKPKAQAGKSLITPPLELEPIYPDYFTPSERLAKLDGEVAQMLTGYDPGINFPGNPVLDWTIAEASALEWREMIMVRMGTGKQAKLLGKDIPDKSPPVFPLPPGVEEGYAGVRQLTKKMWNLGKGIDEAAAKMIQVFGESFRASEDDRLHDFPLEWWMREDDAFTRVVQSGWCDWAVCVNLFTQLTKEEQQKITDVLGFVGSEEQGWHAYGAKTFMRSKRLPELIRCRRAVREALND